MYHLTEANFKLESSADRRIAETVDEQTIAQAELDAYISAQAQAIAPEIEIDSIVDHDFGTLYRVWDGHYLLGTYYHALDDKWVVIAIVPDATHKVKQNCWL